MFEDFKFSHGEKVSVCGERDFFVIGRALQERVPGSIEKVYSVWRYDSSVDAIPEFLLAKVE